MKQQQKKQLNNEVSCAARSAALAFLINQDAEEQHPKRCHKHTFVLVCSVNIMNVKQERSSCHTFKSRRRAGTQRRQPRGGNFKAARSSTAAFDL